MNDKDSKLLAEAYNQINEYYGGEFGTPFLTREQMEKLPTPRLLAYFRSIRKQHVSGGYYSPFQSDETTTAAEDALEAHLKEIKSILDTRENI